MDAGMPDVLVVGAGAAGCMAAIAAAERGASVLLIERNAKIGRKLYITGKGRCNLTNDCAVPDVLAHIVRNPRFLIGALSRFPPSAVQDFFTGLGVPLKTERGGRVFPASDRAADVIDALLYRLRRLRVSLVQDRILRLARDDKQGCWRLSGENGAYAGTAVVLATGGASYPMTGSTGDGYALAAGLGHTIVPLQPSLVPLEAEQDFCAALQGLSLRNVAITVKEQGRKKPVYQGQGELLFTHFGLSGPLILSASACMRSLNAAYTLWLDLKPALDDQTLDARLVRELSDQPNRDTAHILENMLPKRMAPVLLALSGVPPHRKANAVTKAQRGALLEQFKRLRIDIRGKRPLAEGIVTAGGVEVREIDPKTMASRRAPGVFIAGELLDVDGYTGGFHLQIAWATGRAAGAAAAQTGGKTDAEHCH